jgi:hypothetical protein
MQSEWFAVTTYKNYEQIVTAINDFIIEYRLVRHGVDRSSNASRLEDAKKFLDSMFEALAALIASPGNENEIAVGSTPVLCSLARAVSSKEDGRAPGARIQLESIPTVRRLLQSRETGDSEALVAYLSEFRTMIEQQMESGAREIIGGT